MRKPTYYLWRTQEISQETYEAEKERYVQMGFRVVTFQNGKNHIHTQNEIQKCTKKNIPEPIPQNIPDDIQEGIRALIQNHANSLQH